MRKKLIVSSKFNIMTGERNHTYNRNEVLRYDREWIFNRMRIFMNFTCKSLIGQTNQNFTAVYAYDDDTEALVYEALNNYPKLPENILFVKKSLYNNLIYSLSDGYDLLYLTRLDSDDLYSDDYIDRLLNYDFKEDTEVLLSQNGYIYDSVNNGLAEYYHLQFTYYTFIYRLYKENLRYDSLNVTPWDLLINFNHGACIFYKYEVIEGRNFIFNIHGGNTDSGFGVYDWGFAKSGPIIEDEETKKGILAKFIK